MRLGTRASALALVQARSVAEKLKRAGTEAEIVEITTPGDRGAAVLDKSRWVSALEQALLDDRIDIAVHSAKDVPTELPDGLELVAVPPRADARDAICGAPSLDALAAGARIGTSSLRRRAQIHAVSERFTVVELRGNVDTRLRKLADHEVDAVVLALAGLERLDRSDDVGGTLHELVPAAGQGALALEARAGALPADLPAAVDDPVSRACVEAERQLVHALGASCHTPVGAHARERDNGGLHIVGWVGLPDGSAWLHDELDGDAADVGTRCAERMLSSGAAELLTQAAGAAAAG